MAWIDYDRDGWQDLYLVNGGHWEELLQGKRSVSNALYRNNGNGTFTEVTRKAGVGGDRWGMGVAAADYDNDGWPDLFVCNFGPNNSLPQQRRRDLHRRRRSSRSRGRALGGQRRLRGL